MPLPRTVTTVTGVAAVETLGPTLAHEHLYLNIQFFSKKADNVLQDVEVMARELQAMRAVGGGAVIEVTPEGIGRDPVKLREISRKSGVPVVSGIAFYVEETYPQWVHAASRQAIADYFIREIEEGTGGVRAGILGEITSHNEAEPRPESYRLRDHEKRIFEAAAIAQKRTGVGITTHASLGRAGHAQLDVFEAAGADLRRIAIGHCDAHWHADPEQDLSYYLPMLERGAFIAFDMIGWSELAPDEVRAQRIAALVKLGYEKQVLLATDTCRKSQLRVNGGRGYGFIWESFLPRLRALGVTETQIRSMLVDAPHALLAGN